MRARVQLRSRARIRTPGRSWHSGRPCCRSRLAGPPPKRRACPAAGGSAQAQERGRGGRRAAPSRAQCSRAQVRPAKNGAATHVEIVFAGRVLVGEPAKVRLVKDDARRAVQAVEARKQRDGEDQQRQPADERALARRRRRGGGGRQRRRRRGRHRDRRLLHLAPAALATERACTAFKRSLVGETVVHVIYRHHKTPPDRNASARVRWRRRSRQRRLLLPRGVYKPAAGFLAISPTGGR